MSLLIFKESLEMSVRPMNLKGYIYKREVTAGVYHIFLSYISKVQINEYRFKNKACTI